MTVFLPTPGQALVDPRTGHFTSTYRRWANALTEAVNAAQGSTVTVPAEPVSFVISGAGSVTADGSVAGGEFVVTLVGDKDSPPPNSFYGVTTAGYKGFVPVYDALMEGQGIAIRDSGYIVIDTVETPDDLPLAGNSGEAVRVTGAEPGLYAWDGSAFTIDTAADGAVTVTCDATAAEIPYDNATSGLAATDVQAAIDEVATIAGNSGAWVTTAKSADEARSSTATLADDSALHVSLPAGKYSIRCLIHYSIANATMDFKYALNFTGTVTNAYGFRRLLQAGNPGGAGAQTEQPLTALPNSSMTSTSAGGGYLEIRIVVVASTSGTLSFQWAQNTSDPGLCTVLAGSNLEYLAL